jgi:hypothetical protein
MIEQTNNPYLAEIDRMEKMRAAFEALAQSYYEREKRAFNQIEAAKVRALQHTLREAGQELCAADGELVAKSDTRFYYSQTFRPRIHTEGQTHFGRWRQEHKRQIFIFCSGHLSQRSNRRVFWFEEFAAEHPESACYMQTYESLKIHPDYGYMGNIHSLLIQRGGQWVRELDEATVDYVPVTRIYPVRLFERLGLPVPDQSKLDLPEKSTRTVYSPLDDLDTEIVQEPWDKLFE